MQNRAIRAALALLALASPLAACEDPLDLGNRSMEGRWEGTTRVEVDPVTDDSVDFRFVLELDQTERDISGTGTIEADGETVEVTVDGRWEYPAIELVFSAPEYATLFFDGAFAEARADSVGGTLSGSGLDGARLSIFRQ